MQHFKPSIQRHKLVLCTFLGLLGFTTVGVAGQNDRPSVDGTNAPNLSASSLIELVCNQISQVRTLDLVYDCTSETSDMPKSFDTERFICDYSSGFYTLTKIVAPAENTNPQSYVNVEHWNGSKRTVWDGTTSNISTQALLDEPIKGSQVSGSASVSSVADLDLFFLQLKQGLFEDSKLQDRLAAERREATMNVEADFTTVRTKSFILKISNDTYLPKVIDVLANDGENVFTARSIQFGEYKLFGSVLYPSEISVLYYANNHVIRTRRSVIIHTDHSRVNESVDQTLSNLVLPVGCLVKDYTTNQMYHNPPSVQEGKSVKSKLDRLIGK